MPSSHPKRQRSSKLFQCTGYGDCCMIFTRGEHLARHTRKHTGEKPFVCIMSNCNKSFSRYDNMMQHTQTHRREPLEQSYQQQQQQQHSPILQSTLMDKVVLRQPSSMMNYSPISPVISSAGSMTGSSCSSSDNEYDDDDDEEEETRMTSYFEPNVHDSWIAGHRRRLSVAELCNPVVRPPLKVNQLTHDEVEALQAFGKLRQATC